MGSSSAVQANLEPICKRTFDHVIASVYRVVDVSGSTAFRQSRVPRATGSHARRVCVSAGLSRTAGRQRELGVRLVIGAGRPRLARQFDTESLMPACRRRRAGSFHCEVGRHTRLESAFGKRLFRAVDLEPDMSVLLFTFTVALIAGALLGEGVEGVEVEKDVAKLGPPPSNGQVRAGRRELHGTCSLG